MTIKTFVAVLVAILFSNTILAQKYNGYTLVSVMNSSAATLYDTNQNVFKTWTGLPAQTGYSSYIMPGGYLVRSAKATGVSFMGGPICGKIQKHDYSGALVWDFIYSTTSYVTHHDICPLPNGNVLAIAYERRTATEVSAAGGNNAIEMWPDKIVEIEPTGPTTGNVVWEWKAWDHLMQNVNPAKSNYVTTLADHPGKLNINYKQTKDWIHMNGLDYNPILDQIAFSSHNLNEIYIIDHSTTTAEAATNAGGNSGKGGDILYRWGNPVAYGASGTAVLNVTHDAHWIREGMPNAGRLVAFNNKGVSSTQSAVDYVITPASGYTYTITPGAAFSPSTYTSRIACNGYTSNMGNSYELPNGNTLICIATSGKVYEINAAGTQLWSKTFSGSVPQSFMYDSCYLFNTPPSIPVITVNGNDLSSSAATTYQWYQNGSLISGATNQQYTPTSSGIFVVRITDANGCVFQYSKGQAFTYVAPNGLVDEPNAMDILIYPNPGTGIFNVHLPETFGSNVRISIIDHYGRMIKQLNYTQQMNLSDLPNGIYSLMIRSEKSTSFKKITLMR
jgi:hypothetical protein